MLTNDLNNAYAIECERRNDERRAAAESQRARELLGAKRQMNLPSLLTILGFLAMLIVIIRAF